jgi:uncharacterized protein (DUF58 family)
MERFLEPRTLARVKDLPLVAKTVAEGFLHGIQPSHQRGIGIEFSQYRAYEPGDEPARIDWKLYARSDRYFVREADRESEIGIWFILDCSRSMAMRSEGGAWTKFEYARHLLATLSYLAQRQGDMIGLLAAGGDQRSFLPLASGERHWHQLLKQLARLEPRDRFPPATELGHALRSLQAPGLVILISDFHEAGDEWVELVRQASTPRNEVAAIQLLCRDEREFPWHGAIRFEDLESGETVLVSGKEARKAYLQRFSEWQEALHQALGGHLVNLDSFDIDQPMDEIVFHYLASRQKQAG